MMPRWKHYEFRFEDEAVTLDEARALFADDFAIIDYDGQGRPRVKLQFSDDELEAAFVDRDAEGNGIIERHGKRLVMAYHADWSHCAASGWPMYSDAMGVDPSQIRQAEEHSRRAGVPTHFDPRTGCAILTSRSHRKRYAHAIGLYERNAGYSDPAPRNR